MTKTLSLLGLALFSSIAACTGGPGEPEPATSSVQGAASGADGGDAPVSAATAAPKAKGCSGTPTSCRSLGPGGCSSVLGCSMDMDVSYDAFGNPRYDDYCDGSARACDRIDSEDLCVAQGCEWK